MSIKIYPSLLAANQLDIGPSIEECISQDLKTFHIDIMDMHYVPNIGLSTMLCQQITERFPDLQCHVHLMTLCPERYLDALFSSNVTAIAIHPHTTQAPQSIIKDIQKQNIAAGLAINPHEPLDSFFNYEFDYFLMMGVTPGFSGQTLNQSLFEKIKKIKDHPKFSKHEIVADGGINIHNINQLVKLNVDGCVIGSGIFNHKNAISENILKIKDQLASMK